MRFEAITQKKALDGLLDLMSKADMFNPDPDKQEPVNTDKLVPVVSRPLLRYQICGSAFIAYEAR